MPRIAQHDTLVYLSLGSGRHVDEIRFSVLSASRYLQAESSWRIVIYTDDPRSFEGLPLEFRIVDPAIAASWKEPHGYFFRSKTKALEASLKLCAARSILVDGDTYFKQSPDELFRRVAPGASVLHLREGPPAPPVRAAIRHVLKHHVPIELDGRRWALSEYTTVWNSGVAGLHRSDVALCERALHLMDQLTAHDFHKYTPVAEQLALGMCLEQHTVVSECIDVVVHYWPTELRKPFRDEMARLYQNPVHATYVSLWPHRPRFSLVYLAKLRIKRAGRWMGVELSLSRGLALGIFVLVVTLGFFLADSPSLALGFLVLAMAIGLFLAYL